MKNHDDHARRPGSAEKQQRRARAAEERAARARRGHRRRVLVRGGLGAAALALSGGLTAMAVNAHSNPAPGGSAVVPTQPRTTADGRTTTPPWDAPAGPAASAAVRQAGLPVLSGEGQALHVHAHLDVYVDGRAVPVPADIGIDEQARQASPLHTHDGSGVIHVESPVQADFTLGQFLTEWQVSASADHLGALRADADHSLTAYVNGQQVSGDPAAIALHAHDEIALVYGSAADNSMVSVPSSYAFPSGA
ncbi:hypothetical protein ACFV6F_21380 [Kitasatospora phosalacinea]|uniref:hypothetical protein n=1 Tax=Kitasatospora phosalacinea TaxID=2065 RepID=UPI0036611EFA